VFRTLLLLMGCILATIVPEEIVKEYSTETAEKQPVIGKLIMGGRLPDSFFDDPIAPEMKPGIEVPEEVIEHYSTGPVVKTPEEVLVDDLLKSAPARTQQEREKLEGAALASTREPVDPVLLSQLADKYSLSSGPLDISLDAPGKRVFTDQAELERIIFNAEDDVPTFKDYFKKARAAGKTEFKYQGELFNTRREGETEDRWLETVKRNAERKTEKIDPRQAQRATMSAEAHKQSLLGAEARVEPEAGFSAAMTRNNVTVKGDIDTSLIHESLGGALDRVAPLLQAAGIDAEITSGKRDQKYWSLHETGEAIDLRLKSLSAEGLKTLKESLPGKPSPIKIEGENGQLWNEGEYDYVIHGTGNNIHLHIEHETADAKRRLAEHLISIGKADKVNRSALKRYGLLDEFKSQLPKVS
jgi:hypothetical protein